MTSVTKYVIIRGRIGEQMKDIIITTILRISLLFAALYCLPDSKTFIGVLAMAMYVHMGKEEKDEG